MDNLQWFCRTQGESAEVYDLERTTREAVVALWRSRGCPGSVTDFSEGFLGFVAAVIEHMADDGEFQPRRLRSKRPKAA